MVWFITLSIPIFYWAFLQDPSAQKIYILQAFIIVGDAPKIAALTYYIPKCFPTHTRYKSLGISFTTGQAILGGTTPAICWILVNQTTAKWSPSLLLVFSSIMYIMVLWMTRKHTH